MAHFTKEMFEELKDKIDARYANSINDADDDTPYRVIDKWEGMCIDEIAAVDKAMQLADQYDMLEEDKPLDPPHQEIAGERGMDKKLHITIDEIRSNIADGVYDFPNDLGHKIFQKHCLEALGLDKKQNANQIFMVAWRLNRDRGISEVVSETLDIMIQLANLLWLVGPTFNEDLDETH
jgi:hypothetical protein